MAKALEIQSPVRLHDSREYSQRLLVVNYALNPRDKLGKTGITFHRGLGVLFHRTIKVNVTLLDKEGNEVQRRLFVNRKSLTKYLAGSDKDERVVLSNMSKAEIIGHLNESCWNDHALNDRDQDFAEEQGEFGENGLRHVGQHNQRRIASWRNSISDAIAGKYFSWFYRKTVESVKNFKIRFALFHKEKKYFKVSEVLAKRRFKEAKAKVPAYKEHLEKEGFELSGTTKLADVPVTTKDNYIKTHMDDAWNTHIKGEFPDRYKIDTSTGTTGKPTVWLRSDEEIRTVKNSIMTVGKFILGQREMLTVNAFALGPWATGLSVHELSRENGSVFSPGDDPEKILECIDLQYSYEQNQLKKAVTKFQRSLSRTLKEDDNVEDRLIDLGNDILSNLLNNRELKVTEAVNQVLTKKDFPQLYRYRHRYTKMIRKLNAKKKQIVISGYPPFLMELPRMIEEVAKQKLQREIDSAGDDDEKRAELQAQIDDFDPIAYFSKYNLIGLVGGQAISEPMRDQMVDKGFMQVMSSLGASDLDINLGQETEAEVELRRTLQDNPGMAREMFGTNKGVPMVFRYDPLNYHIEVGDEDNHLIYTCNRDNRSSPRVRYDIKDTGRVYAASDVNAMLTKYGIFNDRLKTKSNQPYLFIWGRDSTAAFGKVNVPFDELEGALKKVDPNEDVLKRAFYSYETDDNQNRFDIWLELNDGDEGFFEEDDEKSLHAELVDEMCQMNEYLSHEIADLDDDDFIPDVTFFLRHMSPIAEPGGKRKQVLVFKDGSNFNDFKHGEETRQTSRLTKTEYMQRVENLDDSQVIDNSEDSSESSFSSGSI